MIKLDQRNTRNRIGNENSITKSFYLSNTNSLSRPHLSDNDLLGETY